MILTSLYLVLLVAGAGALQAPAQPSPPAATGVIRGRVIAGDTGQPLRNAQVRLNQVEAQSGVAPPRRENRTATTDAEGKYEFKDLPQGRYHLSASKGAYVNMSPGQQQPNAPGKPIDLDAGETLDRVDFTLPRGGVITGRIVDEFGEPLPGLEIMAMRAQTINGRRQLVPTHGSTDDLGEFRMFGLTPGQYYVQAVWRQMGPGDPTSPDRNGYPVTFFPGTTNEDEAQRFTVAAGQTVSGLAMALSPIKTARVEGTVIDVDGRPMGNAFLEVLQSSANNNFMGGQPVRPDGTFTFASLAPGDYVFRTRPTATNKNVAMLKLAVGSEDISNLRLVALPPAVVSGRIVIEPSMPMPMAAFSLMAAPDNYPMPGGSSAAKVSDNLTFELTATPGKNRIWAVNLPAGWEIRSVRVNSIDVIDDGIELKPGDRVTGVDVELTNRIATVSGLVTNARGEPAKDYTVLIFPADSTRWKPSGRYVRTARPEQDGRFKVPSVVPADYYIIAIDKLEPGQWTDPEFLERVRSKATSISVNEGESKSVDLKVSTAS